MREYIVLSKDLVDGIEQLRQDWGIKGVAIAVVRKGEDGSWKEDTFGLGIADAQGHPVTDRVSLLLKQLVREICEADPSAYRHSLPSARTRSSSPLSPQD